jgi:ATP-binding cassette, subfamily B, bacterial
MFSGILRAFHIYLRALREVRAFWPALLLILALGLASIPLSLLLPLPLKLVIDNVLNHQPVTGLASALPGDWTSGHRALLVTAISLSVGLGIVNVGWKLVDWLLRETVAERMVQEFRGKLLYHGLRMPPFCHAVNGTQDLGYRINQDAQALQWTAIYGLIPLVVGAANIGCTLYASAMISGKLALLALGTAAPTVILIHLYQGRLKSKWLAAKEQDSAAQSLVHEVLGALRVVTLYGQERRELSRFLCCSGLSVAARLRALRTEGMLGAMLSLSAAVGGAITLYVGLRYVESGLLSTGDLLLVITYIGQLYGPIQSMGTHATGQQHAIASAERAFAVLDTPIVLADRPDAPARGRAEGHIVFRNVRFGYGDREIFERVNLGIPAGTTVGLVGRTGAGKTTLINLLLRLFDPLSGEIRLDGIDLRDWRLADLRRQFAVLPQDAPLFSTTVAENIVYGRPGASEAEIVAAASRASADAFIRRLPNGYHTPVGERGARLSGGERQRIALARALLLDAPVIVLDEPTSAVDRDTESAIIESLERLRAGRTVFVITHRAATLRHMDMILRVEGGQVWIEDLAAPLLRTAS